MNNTALVQLRKWQTGENRYCFECKTSSPTWASLPYGIYLCYNCSGLHRGMGVHLSFVRSIEMDSWTEKQLAMMQMGGNQALRTFFEAHGISDSNKYKTYAANYYRERMRALVNETQLPDEPVDWGAVQEAPKQQPQITQEETLPPENNVCGKHIAKFWEQAQKTTKQAITKIDEKISKSNIKEEAILIGQQLTAKTKELGEKSTKVADQAFKNLKKGFDDAFGFIKKKAEQVINKDTPQPQQQEPQLEVSVETQTSKRDLYDIQEVQPQQQPVVQQPQILQQQQQISLIDYEEYFQEGPSSVIIYEKPIQQQQQQAQQGIQQPQKQDLLDLFDDNDNQRPQQTENQSQQAITNLLDL